MNSDLNGVPLREAADHLNTTVEAVRMRIRRKSLEAYKVDGRWYVVLPERDQDATEHATTEQTTTREREQPTGRDQDAVHPMRSKSDQELIDLLKEQLSAERQAHRETRATLMHIAQRVPALAASLQRSDLGTDEQRDDVQPIERATGRFSRLWQRLKREL